ncbi:MAG: sulfite exporter TauE/SafE family protein [Planctomycetota bacterium]|jgi:uncharacterized membrane protein YfcA
MLLAETIDITHWGQWLVLILGAFAIGIAKTGVPGIGILVAPLWALTFPSKASVGLLLPVLIFADLFAVWHYRRQGNWRHLIRLLPAATVGIVAGFLLLGRISNAQFKPLIGAIVLVMLILRLPAIIGKEQKVPSKTGIFAPIMGFSAGATSMLANAAGPVMALYLLSMRFDKIKFVGTAAWFFFIINWIKVPFQVHLGYINPGSLKLNVMVFPAVALGAFTGIWLIKRIPQKLFNIIALTLAAAAAVKLLSTALTNQ